MKRKMMEEIRTYLKRFDTAANFANKYKMDLPPKVQGLKFLDDADLSEQDWKLVLTGVDFDKEDQVYKAVKVAILKFMRTVVSKKKHQFGNRSPH